AFPDLPQWTVGAVDWIVIGNWQSGDGATGFWAFARQTAKQLRVASVRVSSHYAKIRARADVVMRDSCRNENDVAGADLDGLSVLAAESQSCGAIIDTERFVRRAVIMSKGIDAVSPGVAPIVLSESALENGSAILRVDRDRCPIQQHRQNAARINPVILKMQLLRLDDLLLLSHRENTHKFHGNIERAENNGRIQLNPSQTIACCVSECHSYWHGRQAILYAAARRRI